MPTMASAMKVPTSLPFVATMLAFLILVATPETAGAYVPGMYVFGDSTADVGNNDYLPGNASTKANFPYNGIDFPGQIPTGRFCNGYIGIDFLAQKLGFEKSPPAALSIDCPSQELKGVNFASGGSGIFDTTSTNVSLSMNKQIKLFGEVARRLMKLKGKKGAKLFLCKSLFVFSTGNNDMFAFLEQTGLQNQTQNDHFVSSLTIQFKDQLEELYDLGARKFAIFGVGPVGCVPVLRTFVPSGGCLQSLNDLARRSNSATRDMLLDLKCKLKGMEYSFAETYEISTHIGQNARQLGFKELTRACCGGGVLNAQKLCTPQATCCPNRGEYLNWDYAHPTEAAYKLLIDIAYDGPTVFNCPINFHQLALL